MDFLDVDIESHRQVLNLLPPKDLANVAACCRYFYQAVYDGPFAEGLWKYWCTDLLGPGVVALHEAALPAGYRAGAIFWRDLFLASHNLDRVRWWRHGAQELKSSVERVDAGEAAETRAIVEAEASKIATDNADGLGEERRNAVLAEAEAAAAQGGKTLKSKLARSGHTANLIGTRVVITGGILRDGSLYVDIVAVNLATLEVSRPPMGGTGPSTRFRHTLAPIRPSPGSSMEVQIIDALGSDKRIEDGELLFCFGGYNTIGEEFGANSTFVLWAAYDGSAYVWVPVKTTGQPPSPRFHHSSDSFDDGRKVVVFGGEGYRLDDAGEGPSPCVYILDVDNLTWQRCNTHSPVEEHSPGTRSLHVTTVRRSPVTGREELVVVGGYCASLLAEMKPFTLDLQTLYWRCWPGVKEGENLPLPTPRQRMAAMRITHDWFLVSGGSPTSGSFLEDVQRLHIPTLVWGPPPAVSGRPSRALRRIAGHTFAGLLAFGGCIPTIMGIMPVEKLDLLLLGTGTTGLIPLNDGKGMGVQVAKVGEEGSSSAGGTQDSSKAGGEGGAVSEVQLKHSLKLILSGKQQALECVSEPDSPVMTSAEASAKARSGDMALEEALQEGVMHELMQDQLLNKGQRINIGSPDTYFRPVYATAAGVKSMPEQNNMVQGRLQVISTSVLNDPEHMEQMNRQFHNDLPRPHDEETAAAIAAAELVSAAAAAGKAAARTTVTAERSASSPAAAQSGGAAAEDSGAQAENPSVIATPSEHDAERLNPFKGLADATSGHKLSTVAEVERPAGHFASAPVQKGIGSSLVDTQRASVGKEDATRRHTAAEKGKAKAIEFDEVLYQTSALLGPSSSDEAGPSQPQVDLRVNMAVQGPSTGVEPIAVEPKGLFDSSFGTHSPAAAHESTSEEDTTGSAVATTMYQYLSESPRMMNQHTQMAPASSSGAGAAQSGVPSFWYNAVDAGALSAASTGEMENQVRSTTEAQGIKAPITSAHLGMQGSHAIYAVSSVRNDDPLVGGPNPFADVRSLWSTEWCGAQQYTLLPPDAELPPEAVARLTVPEGSWPLHVSLSENEQAPQPSCTSPVEANLAHVQSPPESHTTPAGPGLNSTGAVQSRTLGTLRRRPGPKGFLDAVSAVSGFRQSASSSQTASVLPSAPLAPPSTGLGSKMSTIGGWSGAAATAVGQKSIGQPEMRPSKEHAQGMHSKIAAHQKSLAATVPLAAPSTEAAVVPQSILAETGDAQGPIRVQLWRDTATGQLYRLPRQPEAKLACLGAETAAAASSTEISQDGSLKPGTDSKASKSDLGQCSIQ
ncbi:g7280 [Coccomyxa elongata]